MKLISLCSIYEIVAERMDCFSIEECCAPLQIPAALCICIKYLKNALTHITGDLNNASFPALRICIKYLKNALTHITGDLNNASFIKKQLASSFGVMSHKLMN